MSVAKLYKKQVNFHLPFTVDSKVNQNANWISSNSNGE